MIKNALRIGRLLALSSLLSIAITAPMAVIEAGATALAQAASSDAYASWAPPAVSDALAQANESSAAEENA